jgi:hypothetical protein
VNEDFDVGHEKSLPGRKAIGFYVFGASAENIKKIYLCVLGASAVNIYYNRRI